MKKTLYILLTGLSALSCTRVTFSDEQSTRAKYSWEYTADGEGARMPEKMFLALARSVNTIHDTLSASPSAPDTLWIENGDYYAITCGSLREDAYSIENVEAFLRKEALSEDDPRITGVMDLYARLPEEDPAQYDMLFQALFPKTHSGMEVIAQADSLWVAADHRELQWKPDAVQTLQFPLTEMTTELTLNLDFVSDDPDQEVDRVAAALVGVPSRVKIQNGTVGLEALGRSLFEMTSTGSGVSKCYTGKVRCLGMFPPVNAGDKYSYGILHVAFQMKGDPRILEAKINLYSILQKTPVLRELEQSGRYLLTTHKATLDLPAAKVSVHVKKTEAGGQDEAVSVWAEDENNNIEVIPEDGDQL